VLSTGANKFQENRVCFDEDSVKYNVCDPFVMVKGVFTV
jgi:hypothetical protein